MDAMQTLAAHWIAEHPEYHPDLAHLDAALARLHSPTRMDDNPFLHLSMHLSISEQCSIDQPPGIRQAVEHLIAHTQDLHAAHHEVMECLGRMLWESQRSGQAPDAQAYLAHIWQRATRGSRTTPPPVAS